MKALKIIVIGSGGRMGKEVVSLVNNSEEFSLLSELRRGDSFDNLKCEEGAIVVDFSDSSLFSDLLAWCKKNKLALVSGTTALEKTDFDKMASSGIPLLWAPNMSIGVALLNKLVKQLSELPEGFKFEMNEVHHKHKKDAPSGTALYLHRSLEEATGQSVPEPSSERVGEVFGDHSVTATSSEEMIKIEHKALNRKVWASGALKAAVWLSRQSAGVYSIEDVLQAESS